MANRRDSGRGRRGTSGISRLTSASSRRRTSVVDDDARRRSSAYHRLPEKMERVQRSPRDVLRLLTDLPLLADLHDRERATLAEIAEIVRCPGGTVIYEPGQPGTHLYLILQGSVEVGAQTAPGIYHAVRQLEDGDAMGLDAVLGGEDYHMHARALQKTAALRLRTDAIRDLVEAGRPAGVKLFVALANTLGDQIRTATLDVVRLLSTSSMRMAANARKRSGDAEYSDEDMKRLLGGG